MNSLQTFSAIMVTYAFISFVIFPVGFYYSLGKQSIEHAGYGYVCGTILSLTLWGTIGRHMI